MAAIEVLMTMAGLWLASSVVALVALAGIYVAERTRPRSTRRRPTGVPGEAATGREAPDRSRQREAA